MPGPTCSFCGKSRERADYLVAGPGGVSICDQCAELASRVAREALGSAGNDLLLTGIARAVTNDRRLGGLLGVIEAPAIAIREGRISWIGAESDLPRRYRDLPEHDCGGRSVVPGFIDASTRLLSGPEETHIASALEFSARMLARGTTAMGLHVGGTSDPEAEAQLIAAAGSLGSRSPSTVAITWTVAGPEVARVVAPAASRIAGYAEITCGGDEQAANLAKRVAPMKPRLRTCDHPACRCWVGFEPATAVGRKVLGSAAIPLLRVAGPERFASDLIGRIESEGRALALASESSLDGFRTEGVPFLIHAAVDGAGMSFEVALWAATRGGALAIGDQERGRIRLGAHADLVVLDTSDPSTILDKPDGDQAETVVVAGAIAPR